MIKNVLQKAVFPLQQKSPELLIVGGIAACVAGTVLACKATLKADKVIEKKETKLEMIYEAEIYGKQTGEYTEEDKKHDLTVTYVQTAMDWVKLYALPAGIIAGGIVCILSGYNIINKRNIALVAAYNILETGFKEYRGRVIEELGETKDRHFRFGTTEAEQITKTKDVEGKTKKDKNTIEVFDSNNLSCYARFFDDGCRNWSKAPEQNLYFLRAQQAYANNMLEARGHVFLNEVYDMLGIPRTKAGSVVGWWMGKGDSFVDFGIYEKGTRDFVNGYEPTILLDFNVDGVITGHFEEEC